jgi:hypothetical protein
MVGEAIAGLSAVKTAFDMVKALQNIHDVAARDRAVIELQKEILTAQEAQSTLIKRVGELEKEVARFETWESTKERYELKKLPPSIFLYELKAGVSPPEPAHFICTKCYEHRKRAILHGLGREHGIETFLCHECDTKYYVGTFEPSPSRRGSDSAWGV